MKNFLLKRFLPALLTLVMLFSICAPAASALSFSSPNEEEPLYTVTLEDGVVRIKLNAEKVYEMLCDGDLSREELLRFIPEDVLETLKKGSDLTVEDLTALASEYITAEDLSALKDMIPLDILSDYFDLAMLEDLVTLEELMSLVSPDEILEGVESADIEALVTEEVLDLLLANETAKNTVLTTEFVERILFADDNKVLKDVLADRELRQKLIGLVDAAVVERMLEDPEILDSLVELMETEEKVNALLGHDDVVDRLAQYLSDHSDRMSGFMQQDDVKKGLKTHPEIFLHEDILRLLIEENVLTRDNFLALFDGNDEAMSVINGLLTEEAAQTLLGSETFVNNVFGDTELVTKVANDDLLAELYAERYITPNHVLVDGLLSDPADEDTVNAFAEAYGISDADLLALSMKQITMEELCEKYSAITGKSLLDNGFADRDKAYGFIKAILTDPAHEDHAAVTELFVSGVQSAGVALADYWKHIDNATFKTLTGLFSDDVLHDLFDDHPGTFESLLEGIDEAVVDQMYDTFAALPSEDLVQMVKDHIHDVLNAVPFESFLEYDGFDTIELIHAIGGEDGYFYLVNEEILTVGEIATAIGGGDETVGYRKILDLLGPEKVINEIGLTWFLPYINFNDVIDAAGGYNTVVGWYSIGELSEIFGAIGFGRIRTFLNDTGILDRVDFKGIATELLELIRSRPEALEAFVADCRTRLSRLVNREVSTLELNGKEIYRYGEFDLQTLLTVLLQAIPDMDRFLALEEGETFAELILSTELRGEGFALGVSVEFVGDLTDLKSLAASYADFFRFDVTDELDVTAEVIVPAVASELYERALLTERLPESLRVKVLELPTMTVAELSEWMASMDDETLQVYADEIYEKLDEIRDRVYAKLDETLGDRVEQLQAAKDKVDGILEKFSDGEKLGALRDKAVSVLNRVSDRAGERTVSDYYLGNGTFRASASFSVDVFAQLNHVITLPEDLKVLFGNDMTLRGSADVTVTLNGVYRLSTTDADGVRNTFYLPEGISLDLLYKVPGMNYTFEEGAVMPAADVDFIHEDLFVLNFRDENGTLISSVGYTDDHTLADLEIPTPPAKEGYTVEWESYEDRMWDKENKEIDVKPIYTAISYSKSYNNYGLTFEYTYDVTTRSMMLPTPTRVGYTFTGWSVDTDGDGMADFDLIPAASALRMARTADTEWLVPEGASFPAHENAELIANFTVIEYTVTFMTGAEPYPVVTFNTEDATLDASEIPAAPVAPGGYSFVGWYADINGDGDGDDAEDQNVSGTVLPLAHLKAYPRYMENRYTATVKIDGATVSTLYFKTTDTVLTGLPSIPAKEGYTSLGWYVDVTEGEDVALEGYTLPDADITVYAKYEATRYTATVQVGDATQSLSFTVEDTEIVGLKDITIPAAEEGYKAGVWYYKINESDEGTALGTTLPAANITLYVYYEPKVYTATVKVGDITETLSFTVQDTALEGLPALPAAAEGYTNVWWFTATTEAEGKALTFPLPASNITVFVHTEATEYTATVKLDDTTTTLTFTVEDETLTGLPTIPEKEGYEIVGWYVDVADGEDVPLEGYDLPAGDITVYASYKVIRYEIRFIVDNRIEASVEYDAENKDVTPPTLSDKPGYTVKWYVVEGDERILWSDYELTFGDVTVEAAYAPITYTATFTADGEVVGTVDFTVTDIEAGTLTELPAVPDKKGYTGAWDSYTLGYEDLTVEAKYEVITYTATFMADGQVVATVNFTVHDETIDEPEVPAKDGYTGAWAAYVLDAADLTIEAIYTEEEGGLAWLWWLILILILVIVIVILVIVWMRKNKKDDGGEPPVAAAVAPEPEPEQTPEEELEAMTVLSYVEAKSVGGLMTDEAALAALETTEGASDGFRVILNVQEISDRFKAGDTVDLAALKAKGLVPDHAEQLRVNAAGYINKPLTVIAESFSTDAIKMITLTGGKAIRKQ